MTRGIVRALLGLSLVTLPACQTRPIRLDDVGARFDESQPREVKARACGFMLVFPFVHARMRSRLLRAKAGLEDQANGAVLANVRVEESAYSVLFGTVFCTELAATAYPRLP